MRDDFVELDQTRSIDMLPSPRLLDSPLKVLDPASGSGSFLIYAYQVLEAFYRRGIDKLRVRHEARAAELLDEGRTPMDIRIELADLDRRLEGLRDFENLILERHIYGGER